MYIDKPDNLEKHDLIAMIGVYDVPQGGEEIAYSKSELAFNEGEGKVLVYVHAKTKKILDRFQKDFPNAEIREDSNLDAPDDWRLLGFPSERLPTDATPLDSYFQARSKEHKRNKEAESLKVRRKEDEDISSVLK